MLGVSAGDRASLLWQIFAREGRRRLISHLIAQTTRHRPKWGRSKEMVPNIAAGRLFRHDRPAQLFFESWPGRAAHILLDPDRLL